MKSFLIQPFHQRVHVTADPQEFQRKYNTYASETERMELKELEDCRGMATHLLKKDKAALFMLYLEPNHDDSTLFHECLHMAHFVMDYVCAPISMESTETQAYLMESIVANVRKKLK